MPLRPALLVLTVLAALGAASPFAHATESVVSVPVGGQKISIRICRPEGRDTAPLVVVNHGSPAKPEQRPGMAPTACTHEVAVWFLRRGYVVAFPLRRGYGDNGGPWAEDYGRCDSPDFVRGGLETAADIEAAVRHLHTLDFVRPKGTIVVGQSAGGWGTVALASRAPATVAAFVNFAGGRGGWAQGRANTNCVPSALVRSAGYYGATARAPMLWIYTENDTFFAPDLSKAMHGAFVAAGGKAEFAMLPAFGNDGHGLFFARNGSRIWGPLVEPFLAANRTPD
ncbi:MAG: prolyl oligopeptidase family serine peptidase [Rhodospirillales bacterium]|nr:prolyl oligopeptidase family serine peptidase [Rhodospirillales bacterium]